MAIFPKSVFFWWGDCLCLGYLHCESQLCWTIKTTIIKCFFHLKLVIFKKNICTLLYIKEESIRHPFAFKTLLSFPFLHLKCPSNKDLGVFNPSIKIGVQVIEKLSSTQGKALKAEPIKSYRTYTAKFHPCSATVL